MCRFWMLAMTLFALALCGCACDHGFRGGRWTFATETPVASPGCACDRACRAGSDVGYQDSMWPTGFNQYDDTLTYDTTTSDNPSSSKGSAVAGTGTGSDARPLGPSAEPVGHRGANVRM
jgi:hypothetical protein